MVRCSTTNWMIFDLIFLSVLITYIHGSASGTLLVSESTEGDGAWDVLGSRAEQFDGRKLEDYTEKAKADFVSDLPGFGPPKSNTFAGFVTIGETKAEPLSLFYMFVEASAADPKTAPLVLWLNGGPACSAMYGFFEENGPYRMKPGSQGMDLLYNEYTWTTAANIVYPEVPGGVGFSTPEFDGFGPNVNASDRWVAKDTYNFLLKFLERFPQYSGRPLWLSGESYAGHYIPLTALEILNNPTSALNLQGYAIGNAYTDGACYDDLASYEFQNQWGMLSTNVTSAILSACAFPELPGGEPRCHRNNGLQGRAISIPSQYHNLQITKRNKWALPRQTTSDTCEQFLEMAYTELGNVDPYNLAARVCIPPNAFSKKIPSPCKKKGGEASGTETAGNDFRNPCQDNDMHAYLSRPEVRKALHVYDAVGDRPWIGCNDPLHISWNRTELWGPMQPVIKRILDTSTIKLLYYSGNMDSVVPVSGTMRWIKNLLQPTTPFTTWLVPSGLDMGQVAGYMQTYGNLVFTTIRNAGHFVPYDQPKVSLLMFKDWIGQGSECLLRPSCPGAAGPATSKAAETVAPKAAEAPKPSPRSAVHTKGAPPG
eukprot:jgi/Botrbrau1/22048/Bobra.0024s0059.2